MTVIWGVVLLSAVAFALHDNMSYLMPTPIPLVDGVYVITNSLTHNNAALLNANGDEPVRGVYPLAVGKNARDIEKVSFAIPLASDFLPDVASVGIGASWQQSVQH